MSRRAVLVTFHALCALACVAEATEESAQRLLTAAAGSSSASNALTALRINNPEAYQQMLYHEALSRARGQAEGRGTPVSAWEQLLNLRAEQ